jgi:glyoxylase-like metal-dependent hydrolase (beta-lactamase superfamily II)
MVTNNTAVEITTFVLGPIENNTFLVTDPSSHEAVVIDPSFDIQPLVDQIKQRDLQVKFILITHAHFDHIAGVNPLLAVLPVRPQLVLHHADLSLWKDRGEALQCGFQLDPLPNPDHFVLDEEVLPFSSFEVVAHHTPGHSPGHVVFEIPQRKVIFVGDVIFAGSIGRTDLTGGDMDELLSSIRKTILACPDDTQLLPGHGPETTVGIERLNNPYLI